MKKIWDSNLNILTEKILLGADLGNQNIADPDNGVENIAEHDPERKTLQIQILVKKKNFAD